MLSVALTLLLSAGSDLVLLEDPALQRPESFGPLGREALLYRQLWLEGDHQPLSEKPPDDWPAGAAEDWKRAWTAVQKVAGAASAEERSAVSGPPAKWLWMRYLIARKLTVRLVTVITENRLGVPEVQLLSYDGKPDDTKRLAQRLTGDWRTVAEKLLAKARAGEGDSTSIGIPTEPVTVATGVVNGNAEKARVAVKLPAGCTLPGTLDVAPANPLAEMLMQRWKSTSASEEGRLWCNLTAYEMGAPTDFMGAVYGSNDHHTLASLDCSGRVTAATISDSPMYPNPLESLTRALLQRQITALCKEGTAPAPTATEAIAQACTKRGRTLPATLEVSPDNGTAHNLAATWKEKIKSGQGSVKCELVSEEAVNPQADKKQPAVRRFTVRCADHVAIAHLTREKGRTDFGPLVTALAQLQCGETAATP